MNPSAMLARLILYCALVVPTLATAQALSWQEVAGHRKARLPVPAAGKTGFTRVHSVDTGITFTNHLSDERSLTNRNLLSGSGVAAGDIDGDGRCDLYFCSLGTGNALFRNLGDWRFENITSQSGVSCPGQDSTGAAFADVDGDGDSDLLVNSLGGGTRLFKNNGKGQFQEVTREAGLNSRTGSTSLALADVDGDGDLDLYVANYRPQTVKDEPTTRFRVRIENGQSIVVAVNDRPASAPDLTNRFVIAPSGTVFEQGEADVLYLNDGKGHFSPVPFTSGAFLDEDGRPLREPPLDWGLTAQFHDFNGDGAPDLYVCNDLHSPDRIWLNDGRGRFRAIGRTAIRTTSVFSMGVDMADINRDGHTDIFVVDMFSREHQKRHVQVATTTPVRWPVGLYEYRPQINRNTLQINRGDATFAETACYGGVEASEWSWGPIFLDVDLDGFEDIVIMNGQLRDFQNADLDRRIADMKTSQRLSMMEIVRLVKLFPRLDSPKLIFRNRGDTTFEEMGATWGFTSTGIAQGMALADLDNDGDLDIITNNLNESAGLYRNDSVAPRLAVRLAGRPPNTKGIGARIEVLNGPVPLQDQEIISGGRYLSCDEPIRVFAAKATNQLTLAITWRDGQRTVITNAEPNHLYEIHEAAATAPAKTANPPTTAQAAASSPWFNDVSALLQHQHVEDSFDDFERQPLLANRLSQPGPGVCWQDFDGDGWDDLIVGTGRGGQLAIYRQENGRFTALSGPPLNNRSQRDQTSVLVPMLNMVIAGSSNYEDGLTNGGAIRIFDLNRKVAGDAILGQRSSTGPLAMADIDHDGDLDLFVGGRVIPARYPEPATSLLLRNEGGRFVPVQRWDKLGLVNGAVFSDLDGDGWADLVLACDWGPVRVFRNDQGTFTEATEQLGLARERGWWKGVTTGDLDGDGRMDIVASNWGLNSLYRTDRKHPRRVYFGDMTGSGRVETIDAHYEESMGKIVPERGYKAAAAALPYLQERVSSFEAYANASVEEIYGDKLKDASFLEVDTLASTVFFNRGDHFQPVPLPAAAQLAPAFGLCIADVDGDGAEDVFLSQNFFAVNPDAHRGDAGRGLWMRGNGKGDLTPIQGHVSGIEVYGEQRGCALGDYDRDGRVDLVVTQNGHQTRLFRNIRAKPGLRVRLIGPPGNSTAVGLLFACKTPTAAVLSGRFMPGRVTCPRIAQSRFCILWAIPLISGSVGPTARKRLHLSRPKL
jgi:enediyne biosynthesis protein E4